MGRGPRLPNYLKGATVGQRWVWRIKKERTDVVQVYGEERLEALGARDGRLR